MVEQTAADSKSKRYDRQIRIWGAHGQEALEKAEVCLLNAGPTGTETLKNLVLGGIFGFTVVDESQVEARDLGNNFLVEARALGEPKAKVVTDCLKELNESVIGSYVDDSVTSLIDGNPEFFKRFTLVIATQISDRSAVRLDSICREHNVPLLLARSYGLLGYLKSSMREHHVIELKPENSLDDLRLSDPWPELASFAESVDLASLDDVHHKHVPYVVLLLKAVSSWRGEHEGQLPCGSVQQRDFRTLVQGMQRVRDGFPLQEENVDEAKSNANKVWATGGVGPEVRRVLADEAAEVTADSPLFWVMVAALKRFVEQEGAGNLPLEGSLPDMTATTGMYLELQQLYRRKAEADAAAVERHAVSLLESVGRDPAELPPKMLRLFCKNARNIRVIRPRPLSSDLTGGRADVLKLALGREDEASNAALYLLLRAADLFHDKYNRFPGVFDSELEEDAALLKGIAVQLLSECGGSGGFIPDDLVAEVVRFGAAEIHCVAAVVGGMAAQEAIKIITAQFLPVQGTLIYNAMASTTTLLDL